MGSGEGCTLRKSIVGTVHLVQCQVIKSRRLRLAGHVARMEETRSAFKILRGTPTGKRPLGEAQVNMGGNIRMDLKEIGVNTKKFV